MLPALQTQHHETVEGGNYAMSLLHAIQVLHSHAYGVLEARCWPLKAGRHWPLLTPREAMWEVKGQRAGIPLSVGVCIGQGTRVERKPQETWHIPRAVVETRL